MPVPGSSDILVDELFATTTQIRTFVEARLKVRGASVARLRAMRMMATSPDPLRMRDLSEMLGVAARTATAVVDALERDGLVERVRHPEDRRSFLVTLTALGRTRHREAEAIDSKALADATARLGPMERERLRELLALLRDSVEG